MSELSNKTENQIKKITTNREIFVSFIIISELSNKAEMLKRKLKLKRQISDFKVGSDWFLTKYNNSYSKPHYTTPHKIYAYI